MSDSDNNNNAALAASAAPVSPAFPAVKPKKQPWEYSTNRNTKRARARKARLSLYRRVSEQAKAADKKSIGYAAQICCDTLAFQLMSQRERAAQLAHVEDVAMENR